MFIGTLGVTCLARVLGPPLPRLTAVAFSMVALASLVWWWGNRSGGEVA